MPQSYSLWKKQYIASSNITVTLRDLEQMLYADQWQTTIISFEYTNS